MSKGGRLILLKSTLSSPPIYFMSLFVIPYKVSLSLGVRKLSLLNKAFLGSGVGDLLLRMIPFGNRWL